MKKLFGTDGIRAVAGQPPLDPRTVHAIGLALATTLKASAPKASTLKPRVLMGMDTRESSEAIAAQLTAGLDAGGASVENAGIITTPAIAHLTHTHAFAAGIVISASHNPWEDNGIKLFGPMASSFPTPPSSPSKPRSLKQLEAPMYNAERATSNVAPPVNAADRAEYIRFLLAAVPGLSLDNHRIVIDCANGAASTVAPQLFAGLGGTSPSPTPALTDANINAGCGALHPEVVASEVTKHKASLGITSTATPTARCLPMSMGRS